MRAELEKTTRNVWQLTDALIAADPTAGAKFVQRLKSIGISQKDIFGVYLTCTARLLGEWWDQSRVSFVDVNIVTKRIRTKAPNIKILLSGQVLLRHPEDIADLAIDSTACDVPEAMCAMKKFLDTAHAPPRGSGHGPHGAIKYGAVDPLCAPG